MKLYTVPLAPNPMRVTLYLAEREALGCAFDIERIIVNTLKGKHREEAHLARNPWGTLPVLELASGTFITESLSIIDYLEAAVPGPRLLPDDPEAMAVARNIERTVEVRITFDLAWYVHCQKSPWAYRRNRSGRRNWPSVSSPALTGSIPCWPTAGRFFRAGPKHRGLHPRCFPTVHAFYRH